MATMQQDGRDVFSRMAGADLTGKLFFFVKTDSSGNIVLAGSGDPCVGVLMEENNVTSSPYSPVTVQHSGIAKVIAGSSITANSQVQSDGNGKAIALSAGKAIGQLIGPDPVASGDICEVKLF